MADMLVIAGQVVPVTTASDSLEQGGDTMRTNAGALHADIRYEKRRWAVTTGLMTKGELTTLRTATASAARVVCSGSILGATFTCEVVIGDSGYATVQSGGALVLRTAALELVQV